MAIDTLERVMMRLRSNNPNKPVVTINELQKAVIMEAGYDIRTYKKIKLTLSRLGWIKAYKRSVRITGKDLTET